METRALADQGTSPDGGFRRERVDLLGGVLRNDRERTEKGQAGLLNTPGS